MQVTNGVINKGDFFSILEKVDSTDRSYVGDVFEVLVISGSFIVASRHTCLHSSLIGKPYVFYAAEYSIEKLAPELVDAALGRKPKEPEFKPFNIHVSFRTREIALKFHAVLNCPAISGFLGEFPHAQIRDIIRKHTNLHGVTSEGKVDELVKLIKDDYGR